MENPKATSTPTIMPLITGRRGIRDREVSVQSPIDSDKDSDGFDLSSSSLHNSPNASPRLRRRNRPNYQRKNGACNNIENNSEQDEQSSEESDEERDELVRDEIIRESRLRHRKNPIEKKKGFFSKYAFAIVLFCVMAGLLYISLVYFNTDNGISRKEPQLLLENMCDDVYLKGDSCLNIKVAIRDIAKLEQPRTILFLYEEMNTKIHEILKKVANYASCYLNECSSNPIVINGPSLNTSDFINDYGKIIAKYTDVLKSETIMIVNNLEQIPGVTAQAFHSFCDEDNPIVKRALFLFTIQVTKLPNESEKMRYIENYLSNLWNDISKDDKFDPLFARISSTVLTVKE